MRLCIIEDNLLLLISRGSTYYARHNRKGDKIKSEDEFKKKLRLYPLLLGKGYGTIEGNIQFPFQNVNKQYITPYIIYINIYPILLKVGLISVFINLILFTINKNSTEV